MLLCGLSLALELLVRATDFSVVVALVVLVIAVEPQRQNFKAKGVFSVSYKVWVLGMSRLLVGCGDF